MNKLIKKKYALIVGGFGYKNVGDEAQLSGNLSLWKKKKPNTKIIVLSPDPNYTKKIHKVNSLLASRVRFFKSNKKSYFMKSNLEFKIKFIFIYFLLTINAYLIKKKLPTLFGYGKEFILLIRNSTCVHFSGGGYLTGATRSRLWDGLLIMQICQIVKTPYFLTGQTIGLTKGMFENYLIKKGLDKSKLISTRDKTNSIKDLENLKVKAPIFNSYDDAFYSKKINYKIKDKKKYFLLHYHEWNKNKIVLKKSKKIIIDIINFLKNNYTEKIYFLPMTPQDKFDQEKLVKKNNLDIKILNYKFNFKYVRKIISNSKMVISLKHHPIIFSCYENIPSIAISFDKYYIRKNYGALDNYNLKKFSINGLKISKKKINITIDLAYKNTKLIKKKLLKKNNIIKKRINEIFNHAIKKKIL